MSSPVEIAAEALHDRHWDLSSCDYFRGEGTCTFSCHDEPRCQTDQPSEGWDTERLRRVYADLLPANMFGEPSADDVLDAAAVLEALHAAGWQLVRTEDIGYRAHLRNPDRRPGEGDGWSVHPDYSLHMSGCYPLAAITDEWEPPCL